MLSLYLIIRYIRYICVLFDIAILYYLYNLEDATCNCIRDWRHNFIKVMCILSIVLLTVPFIKQLLIVQVSRIYLIYLLLNILNTYVIYTYIDDLNTTQCICAVSNQPKLNKMMTYYIYFIKFIILYNFFKNFTYYYMIRRGELI